MTTLTLEQRIKKATKKWVEEFNAIPQSLIQKAYPNWYDEITIHSTELECGYCGSEVEDGNCVSCDNDHDIIDKYDLPMWGTMWTFETDLDSDWLLNNLDVARDCGIWVYESDELGVFFGVNGAGYDFYESHWIPLYHARGFTWHKNMK